MKSTQHIFNNIPTTKQIFYDSNNNILLSEVNQHLSNTNSSQNIIKYNIFNTDNSLLKAGNNIYINNNNIQPKVIQNKIIIKDISNDDSINNTILNDNSNIDNKIDINNNNSNYIYKYKLKPINNDIKLEHLDAVKANNNTTNIYQKKYSFSNNDEKITYYSINNSINDDSSDNKNIIELVKLRVSKDNINENNFSGKKRERNPSLQRLTAKDYNYILQYNTNYKTEHLIDINNISKQEVVPPSELVLTLLEIAYNSEYYKFNYSNKSKTFWEDILNYTILNKIFTGYRSETLRKYWRTLSKYNPYELKSLIYKYKKFFDSMNLKMLTIVNSLSLYIDNKINDIEKYINDLHVNIRKQETFQETYKDPQTGLITTIKDVRTIITKRRRYEQGNKREFVHNKKDSQLLDDIYSSGNTNLSKFQKLIKNFNHEKAMKFLIYKNISDNEKKIINSINDNDIFVFKVIDFVLDSLKNEFNYLSKEIILNSLINNSMDLIKTYQYLSNSKYTINDNNTNSKKCNRKYKQSTTKKTKGNKRIKKNNKH